MSQALDPAALFSLHGACARGDYEGVQRIWDAEPEQTAATPSHADEATAGDAAGEQATPEQATPNASTAEVPHEGEAGCARAERPEKEFAAKQQRLESANALLRQSIAHMETQVEGANSSVKKVEEALKEEMATRERLQADWNSRQRKMEGSTRAALQAAEESRAQEARAKNIAKAEVADAQSLRFAAEADRDDATKRVAAISRELHLIQEQLALSIQEEVVRQLASAAAAGRRPEKSPTCTEFQGGSGDCTASLDISLRSGFASSRHLMAGLLRECKLISPTAFEAEGRRSSNRFLESLSESVSLVELDGTLARHGHV